MKAVVEKGYSVENVVFGMGGGLEQKVNRDDLNYAQKASAARIKGVWHDVFKDPVTAVGEFVKKSKKGLLATVWNGVAFLTKRRSELAAGEKDRMTPVFRDGDVLVNQSLSELRSNAEYFTSLAMKPPTEPILDPWAQARKPVMPKAA